MIGKLIGGATGALIGLGPMGLILGLAAGHYYDRSRYAEMEFRRTAGQAGVHIGGSMDKVAFTVGVVVLGAKMAKADGKVTRSEINEFKRVFHIPPYQEAQVGALFDHAKRDAKGYEVYAERLAYVFRRKPAVLEELLSGLMLIAAADGDAIQPAEEEFLRDIARIFGFSAHEFNLIAARSGAFRTSESRRDQAEATPEDPYRILGIVPSSAPDAVKTAYRQLIREHHPDKLIAAGMPAEFIAVATEKMKRINAAYAQICRARGIT